ncbi:unnamed protein product [Effrenium voratum]|uniref:Uncharacterized protein n=1 Tax=Effrenium voratum TaxID=2562239 RepID=A0AA36N8T9_9DINO|nr:unnamed protein product [Effrenium voratum]
MAPLLVVGMTSLPSRLPGVCPALQSIVAQSQRPDRLILSLPRTSAREGRAYELPQNLLQMLSQHSWMQVHWVEEDSGPGTKLLGVLDWFDKYVGTPMDGDMLMLLDDDHAYLPDAIGNLWQKQRGLGCGFVSSFFAYFFRGLMVPQGADIVALQLEPSTVQKVQNFYRCFVKGDQACFLVDDLWTAMFYFVCGRQVRSFRDDVTSRGLETIYSPTANASVEALMDLEGGARRDRAMLGAFQGPDAQQRGSGSRVAGTGEAMSGVLGALGVAMGAFGAHGLKNYTSDPQLLESWKTAANYQMLHAVMVAVSSFLVKGPAPKLFSLGCVFFSGSIYGLVLLPKGHGLRKLLGPITPIGGLLFIAGWLSMTLNSKRKE